MTLPRCPDCRAELGEPLEYVDHAVEDIEPGHLVVRLYRQARYRCPGCGQLHLARPPGILPNARFGPNLALLVVMLRLRGMDLDALAELMGHESLETTRIYATLANEELRKRYVACGLLGAASGNG
ncbi:MAG: IS66 family transposase zinc-finger binding domain-containing protein, partial [Halobacteria archaeon]